MSMLGLFNAVSPKERTSRQVGAAIAYGPATRQRLDIYAPRRVETALPVVVFIYGGSWDSGSRNDYGFVGRALAALGHVVVVPDYRVLPEIAYPAFLDDLLLATQWIEGRIGEYGGDPFRLALVGHSAGAYNAVMLALAPRYLAAAGLLDRVKGVVGLSGPFDFYPFDVDITRRVFGGVAEPEATQPVNLVTASAPPMLLGTGAIDKLVYPRNTVALAACLRAQSVPVIERHYAGAGHALPLLGLGQLLRWRVPVLADVAAFLHANLAGAAVDLQGVKKLTHGDGFALSQPDDAPI